MNSHPHLTWLHTGPLRGAFLTLGTEFMQYGAIARSNARALLALVPLPECQAALLEIQRIGQAIIDQAQVLFHGSHEGDGLLIVRVREDRAQHIPIMRQARTPAFMWAWEQPLDVVLATTAAEF